MTNLGSKQTDEMMPAPSKSGSKITYPTLCVRDKSLEAVFGKDLPQVGEELEATLKLRVKGVSSDEYGKRVEFDVVEGDFGEPEEADGSDEKKETGAKSMDD